MFIDEVYLQYVHMIIFIVVKMGKNNNNNLYYIRIMGVLLQASAMSVNKGSASIPFSSCFFKCFFSAALLPYDF